MKKILYAACLLMLVFPYFAFAYTEEKIFEDLVYPGNLTTASNNLSFTLFISSDDLSVLVKFSDRQFSVSNNSCTHDELLNICFKGIELGYYDINRPDPVKGTTYTMVNKAKIAVYAFTSDLNISSEIDKSSLWTDERANVKVTFSNLGDQRAENVVFNDTYPPEIEVYSSTCPFNSFKTYWEGSLAVGETKSCYYVLRALGNITYTSNAKLSYKSGSSSKTIQSPLTIEVKGYALQTSGQYKRNLELGEEATINITLKSASDIAVFNYKLSFPEGMRIIGSNFTETDLEKKTVRFYGSMPDNGSKSFYVRVRANYAGNYAVSEEANFRIQNISFDQKISGSLPFTINYTPLALNLNKEAFSPGKNKIGLFITNPSNNTFYGLAVNISTNLAEMRNASFTEIKPLGSQSIVSDFDSEEGAYPFRAVLYYKSEYGQLLTMIKNLTIVVSSGKNISDISGNLSNIPNPPQNITEVQSEAKDETQEPELKSENSSEPAVENVKLAKIEKPQKKVPLKWMIIAPAAIVLVVILLASFLRKRQEKLSW